MDRKQAEQALKSIVRHNISYNKKSLYDQLKNEIVWNIGFCDGSNFMQFSSFKIWISEMDWIETRYDIVNEEKRYFRKDIKRGMSPLYAKAMAIYQRGKEKATWIR